MNGISYDGGGGGYSGDASDENDTHRGGGGGSYLDDVAFDGDVATRAYQGESGSIIFEALGYTNDSLDSPY